jgi:hypothetical protein
VPGRPGAGARSVVEQPEQQPTGASFKPAPASQQSCEAWLTLAVGPQRQGPRSPTTIAVATRRPIRAWAPTLINSSDYLLRTKSTVFLFQVPRRRIDAKIRAMDKGRR